MSTLVEAIRLRGTRFRLWVRPLWGQWGIAVIRNEIPKPREKASTEGEV